MTELFTQPWQIQLTIASGYAAYLLAFTGVRHHHGIVEVTFGTILFGLLTTAALAVLPPDRKVVTAAEAFFATCLFAILWRKYLSRFIFATLRKLNVTWADDAPSALATLSRNSEHPVSQIAVELDDGTWLECRRVKDFEDAPFRPIIIGPEGDVAFYLTHETLPGKAEKEIEHVRDSHWGDRITYLPAARIRRISLRHK